ncbi:alkaline phosphatase family protein [Granulicella sp. WH15]|uniref:phospholipase C n=1 Tax=Granulicella sp. WH15 TaxID=2602070 RepID=UPI0013676730|nr:alkaline phosphatase family protein [Granulicella sp. WH15]QHN03949.1 alkaline phosphatase family protein [Granulicella sp. WH15]
MHCLRKTTSFVLASLLAATPLTAAAPIRPQDAIKHVVVIFQENVSFDHYFATYPHALNPAGEPAFTALPKTPKVNGLSGKLLTENPNFLNEANGAGKANPFRLSRAQAATADQDHSYGAEQMGFNGGKMDLFPKSVGRPDGPKVPGDRSGIASTAGLTMGFYDGNTVTAYWNYAQHFAMSDNHFNTTFGPSTPGAINLISGQTNGAVSDQNGGGSLIPDGNGGLTMIGDPQPTGDLCSSTSDALVHMTGPNIGDRLTAANVSWGWFQGGFDLTAVNANGSTDCRRSNVGLAKSNKRDYLPHHEPFQYYKSTANPQHVRPQSATTIATNQDGAANHQYDTHDFFDAVKAGNFPAVSYLKAPGYQDGHAGYSTPLDEQEFVVGVINFLQQQPDWEHTAVIIAYDDSDGWYDHASSKIVNGSATKADAYDGPGKCGDGSTALPGVDPATLHAQGRCGYGPRLPLIVVSPWAKANFVDHTLTDQTSILRFIEDIFLDGKRLGAGSFDAQSGPLNNLFDFTRKPRTPRKLVLNPTTGQPQPSN